MRMIARAALGALLAGSVAALPAAAQEVTRLRPRSGLWVDAGAGYGRLRLTCQGCHISGIDGAAFTVTVGGSPSRYVHLGLEGQIWVGIDAGRKEQVRSIAAVAQWFPWGRHNGFFFRGGTGLSDGIIAPIDTAAATVRGLGVLMSISVGYDFTVGRHFALTLQAGDQIAALGDLVVNGAPADDTIGYISRFSVVFTVR